MFDAASSAAAVRGHDDRLVDSHAVSAKCLAQYEIHRDLARASMYSVSTMRAFTEISTVALFRTPATSRSARRAISATSATLPSHRDHHQSLLYFAARTAPVAYVSSPK